VKKTTLEDLEAAEVSYEEHADPVEEPTKVQTNKKTVSAFDDGMDDEPDDMDDFGLDDDDLGWDDDDFGDLGDELDPSVDDAEPVDEMAGLQEVSDDVAFQMPQAGRPPVGCWVANSSHAADHLAAGGAASALQLLNRQIAANNFTVMKQSMITSYLACSASLPGVPGSVSMTIPLLRNDTNSHPGNESLPRVPLTVKNLAAGIKLGYRAFQGGKFSDSKAAFSDPSEDSASSD